MGSKCYSFFLWELLWNSHFDMLHKADLLIVGGTSLKGYPAASFVGEFRGENMVLINRDITNYDRYASLVIHQSLGDVFKAL